MIEKPSKIQPALVGGLIIGLLWSLPFLSLINFCCCLGVLAGGAVAALMLIKRSPVLPVSTGDGAVVGLLAGVVGAGVHLVLGVPISIIFNPAGVSFLKSLIAQINSDPQFRAAMEEALRSQENQGLPERFIAALLGWLVVSVISIGFSALGGVIGVAMFEKRKGQQPPFPPSPPQYGGPGFAPPGPPPGGPPPPGQAPYGQGPPPSY
ncbi:MAG TPA: hypothetical protein VNS63_18215 [Blastocatellia bacterium]|nr:hypothetical protein [Blastocatellia bacterium]